MNPFRNAHSFSEALKTNREETIRLLMEAKVEEWYDGTRQTMTDMLTRWAMDGVNLCDDNVILGLAEGLFDEDNQSQLESFPLTKDDKA
jgi:hypothetical protein